MGLKDLFKKQTEPAFTKEQLDAAVQDALKNAMPTKSDDDFKRTKDIIQMVNSLQRNSPQTDTAGFFKQLIDFENAKQGIIAIEEKKIDDLMQEVEQAQGQGGDETDVILKQLLESMGGLKAQTGQQNAPERAGIPPTPQSPMESPLEIKELPELNAIERAGAVMAAKKIPKSVAREFNKLPEEKKQAVVNAIIEELEQKK